MLLKVDLICGCRVSDVSENCRKKLKLKIQNGSTKKIDRVQDTLFRIFRYPYDEYADSYYALTYFFDGLTGTLTAFGLSGIDGIFAAICLHILAQFRVVKHNFQLLTANHLPG